MTMTVRWSLWPAIMSRDMSWMYDHFCMVVSFLSITSGGDEHLVAFQAHRPGNAGCDMLYPYCDKRNKSARYQFNFWPSPSSLLLNVVAIVIKRDQPTMDPNFKTSSATRRRSAHQTAAGGLSRGVASHSLRANHAKRDPDCEQDKWTLLKLTGWIDFWLLKRYKHPAILWS